MVDRLYANTRGWRPAFEYDDSPNGLRMRMAVYASGVTPSMAQPVFP